MKKPIWYVWIALNSIVAYVLIYVTFFDQLTGFTGGEEYYINVSIMFSIMVLCSIASWALA